jgi:hypothetical protein
MIKAWPTARIAINENCLNTFTMFFAVMKYGLANDNPKHNTSSAIKTLISGFSSIVLMPLFVTVCELNALS